MPLAKVISNEYDQIVIIPEEYRFHEKTLISNAGKQSS